MPGSNLSQFDNPTGVWVSSNGTIYICDTDNNRISKWSSSGTPIGWLGGGTSGWKTSNGIASYGDHYLKFNDEDRFDNVLSIFGINGTLYISDRFNHRISKWEDYIP